MFYNDTCWRKSKKKRGKTISSTSIIVYFIWMVILDLKITYQILDKGKGKNRVWYADGYGILMSHLRIFFGAQK